MKYYFTAVLLSFCFLCQAKLAYSYTYETANSILKDSAQLEDYRSKLIEIDAQKNIEIARLQHMLRQKEAEIDKLILEKKKNDRNIYLLSALSLVLIIGAVFWQRRRFKKQSHSIIKSQVERIQEQAAILKSIAHKQSHDIRGPIATILGLAQLFNYDNPEDHNNRVVLQGIADIAEQLDIEIAKIVKTENRLNH